MSGMAGCGAASIIGGQRPVWAVSSHSQWTYRSFCPIVDVRRAFNSECREYDFMKTVCKKIQAIRSNIMAIVRILKSEIVKDFTGDLLVNTETITHVFSHLLANGNTKIVIRNLSDEGVSFETLNFDAEKILHRLET